MGDTENREEHVSGGHREQRGACQWGTQRTERSMSMGDTENREEHVSGGHREQRVACQWGT